MTADSSESEVQKDRRKMPVLIAAKPGRMRESLNILLKMIDVIDVIGEADDSDAAMRMIHEHRPQLVLLDSNLPGEDISSLLMRIKDNGSTSHCLVLADTVKGRRSAISAGADAALIKGFRTAKLIEVVGSLLPGDMSIMGLERRGK